MQRRPPRLHVIEGTKAPETAQERVRKRVRAHKHPPQIARCPRCNGIELKEVRIGMTRRNGKLSGGTRQWICASCERRGERVVVV